MIAGGACKLSTRATGTRLVHQGLDISKKGETARITSWGGTQQRRKRKVGMTEGGGRGLFQREGGKGGNTKSSSKKTKQRRGESIVEERKTWGLVKREQGHGQKGGGTGGKRHVIWDRHHEKIKTKPSLKRCFLIGREKKRKRD